MYTHICGMVWFSSLPYRSDRTGMDAASPIDQDTEESVRTRPWPTEGPEEVDRVAGKLYS